MDSNLRVVNVFLELDIDRHEVLREVEVCGRVIQGHLGADKDLLARDVVVVGVVNGLDVADLLLLVEVRGVREQRNHHQDAEGNDEGKSQDRRDASNECLVLSFT